MNRRGPLQVKVICVSPGAWVTRVADALWGEYSRNNHTSLAACEMKLDGPLARSGKLKQEQDDAVRGVWIGSLRYNWDLCLRSAYYSNPSVNSTSEPQRFYMNKKRHHDINNNMKGMWMKGIIKSQPQYHEMLFIHYLFYFKCQMFLFHEGIFTIFYFMLLLFFIMSHFIFIASLFMTVSLSTVTAPSPFSQSHAPKSVSSW